MKTACKVFIILSIVSGFILCLFASIFLIPMFIDPEMIVPLLIMFIGIYCKMCDLIAKKGGEKDEKIQ